MRLQLARDADGMDLARAGAAQRARAGGERGPGGDDVVDQHDGALRGETGSRDEGAADVAPARRAVESRLARGLAGHDEGAVRAARRECARDGVGEDARRVETAGSKPSRMDRDRDDQLRTRVREPRGGVRGQRREQCRGPGIESGEPWLWVLEAVDPLLGFPGIRDLGQPRCQWSRRPRLAPSDARQPRQAAGARTT